jgi:D-alanyl-D-alanine carboxypeptidase
MAEPVATWRASYQPSMQFTIPGTVVGAASGDDDVVIVASGDAVLGSEPMTTDAAFHIGSMTKLFTAALIMQLDQEGVLSLDDTIEQWLPAAPNASTVTVRMLVEHTSGLYEIDLSLVGTRSTEDLVAESFTHAPVNDPGTAYTYLNNGYLMLGLIAQDAAGTPYDRLVHDRFIEPLGLTGTYLDGFGDGPTAVNGYDLSCDAGTESDCLAKPSKPVPVASSLQWTGAWSAGGMVSTARDQAVWIRALVTGAVVDAEHRALMQTLTPLSSEYYADAYAKAGITAVQLGEGAGLTTWSVPGVGNCLGHAGSIPGANGVGAHCPDADLTVVILNAVNPAGESPGYPGLVDLAPVARQSLS